MAADSPRLTFAWWNLHDFAHYDRAKISDPRWPKRLEDYEAKRQRIVTVLDQVFANEELQLLAACEITPEAASDLAAMLPGSFDLALPPAYHRDPFQVAVFFRRNSGFTPELPLLPSETEDVTEETRPMIPVHFSMPGHVIRFVACHWISFDLPSSRLARERLADFLRANT